MAETTLKIAREIAEQFWKTTMGCPEMVAKQAADTETAKIATNLLRFAITSDLARLIHEKLTPLVEAAEAVIEAPKGTLPHYVVGLGRELARIKGAPPEKEEE